MLKTKICTKCKIEKTLNEYNFHDKKKNTIRNVCKKCFGKQKRDHFLKNKNKYKKLNRLWQDKNKNKVKERCKHYHKKYYLINKKKIDAKNKKYYLNNIIKVNLYKRTWCKNNPDKTHEYRLKKRAKRKSYNIKGKFTKEEWKNLVKAHNNKCAVCKKNRKLTVDHKIPISKWAIWIKDHPEITYECNDIENIQPLCQSCNSQKGSKIPN